LLTNASGGVSLPAVHACAEIIQQAASITQDGFANLRFAALANVPPGAPFFPAARTIFSVSAALVLVNRATVC
jgi:uncharacterized protein (UPF0210 family)